MKEKELKELKLTKNIIIPFPNFQQNTIISPTQMNDNFEEIEHAYNSLIDNHNGALEKINKVLSDLTSSDNEAIVNEQERVQAEETRVQNEEQRISDEDERRAEEKKRIAMYNTHLNDELRREQKHTEIVDTFNTKIGEVDTFVDTKKEEIDSFIDAKTEEVEEFVDLKTNQVNSFITTKTSEINTFVTAKGQEVQNAIKAIPPKSELIGAKGDKGDKGEKGEKGDRGERGLQGIQGERGLQGVKGDTPSITHLETSISDKINEVETRFNTLTSQQQQDAEVVDARGGETSLKVRLDKFKSQLEHTVVNVFDYSSDVVIVNGKEDWKYAFDNAFKKLQSGGSLLIPKHNYYISSRSVLEDKKNITINCAGVIMPIDGKTPLIGTITFRNLKNCTINGLTLDGNKDNIIYTTTYGSQSLLNMDNCSNMVFNNIKFLNSCESGMNSNGNLFNIIFNNVEIENMGEHGFYFGGTNCKNIHFNNIKCNEIGLNSANNNRFCGVIKFRNKTADDIMHDNIIINGFDFRTTQTGINGHRQLVNIFDVKNVSIKNGSIKGDRASIFSTNISIDNLLIDNVVVDGLYIFYGLNTSNDSISELTPGLMNIKITNSYLNCGLQYFGDITEMSNCVFNCKYQLTDAMSQNVVLRKATFNNVNFILNNYRFDIKKLDRDFEFNNCEFTSKTNTSPLFDFGLTSYVEGVSITFNGCKDTDVHSIFVQIHRPIDLNILNTTTNNYIKSTVPLKSINIQNSKLRKFKIDYNSTFENCLLNGVYDLNGNRCDSFVSTVICKKYNTSVNLDLRYKIAKDIDLNKLIIVNNKLIPFEVTNTIDKNILTLSTITTQETDIVFTVFYNA